jgi:hypothetical protein
MLIKRDLLVPFKPGDFTVAARIPRAITSRSD